MVACLQVSLDGLVAGKSRADAARYFYQTLVLSTHGYVSLEQAQPYGDVLIKPMDKLLVS